MVTFLGELLQDRSPFIYPGWISSSSRAGTCSSMNCLFMAIASLSCQLVRVLCILNSLSIIDLQMLLQIYIKTLVMQSFNV